MVCVLINIDYKRVALNTRYTLTRIEVCLVNSLII